jgi:hypothetical protein
VWVFADLDETIRQLLVRHVPLDPAEIEISFDAPDREWSGRLTRPAVNCFLYDVRENPKLRTMGWEAKRDNGHNQVARTRPPLRIDTTYQLSAWARAREDEHQLLWRLLLALMRFPTLPADLLQGTLKEQPVPIPTSTANPDQMPSNVSDLWQGLDNRVRPVVTYVVTLLLDPQHEVVSPMVLRAPSIKLAQYSGTQLTIDRRLRGRVRDRQQPDRPLTGALVLVRETGARALTDADGRFSFAGVPRGQATLVVRAEGRAEVSRGVNIPSPTLEIEV